MESAQSSSETPPQSGNQGLIVRAFAQALTLPVLLIFVLFFPAGTANWPMAWLLMIAYLGGMLLTNLWLAARHPGLARERLIIPRSSEKWDLRLIGIVNFLLLAAMLPLSGWDHRYGWSPAVPTAVSIGALLLFLAMFGFMAWSMSANEFFSSTVRLQSDRGHAVSDKGPYRRLRHPGYLAMILQFLAIPVILGSMWALIPALSVGAVYLYRTDREDKFLREHLPGYAEYANRVRFRLIPGVW
ncbi:MAG: isoprenylcysteine carboxylmethyltransferase family protein [Anaerolineales bacterium]